MRISRRAEYALRALLLIAKDQKEKVHQIQELSERGNIPVKFLEQILLNLRNEGLLTSKRGVGGGYSLRKRPSEIVILDIVELLDGPIAPLPCASEPPAEPCGCPDPIRCPLRPLMRQARDTIREVLSAKTVQDLLDESRDNQVLAFEI
jgi:Rrf2 family protein